MDFTLRNLFRGVSRVLSQYWKLFLSALAIPFATMFVFEFVSASTNNFWIFLPLTIIGLVIQGCIALITHRITLAPTAVPKLGLKTFGLNELIFLLYFVNVFGVVQLALIFLLTIESVSIFLMFLVVVIFVLSRISVCFPAIAIDDDVNLGTAWKLTKPHQAIMWMVICIFPLAVGLLMAPVVLLLPVATYFLKPLATVIAIIALSLAYGQIRPERFRTEPHLDT